MATVTKPIALDESLNTTETPSRNVADVLAEELQNIAQAIGGGGSGGHTIEDPSGTDMTQRTNLQFADAHLTDDSVNDRTEVENIKDITSADYASATEDGFYNVTDESDEELTAYDIAYDVNDSIGEKIDALDAEVNKGSVSVTADGVKTNSQLFDALYALADISKINNHSKLVYASDVYSRSSGSQFSKVGANSLAYIVFSVASLSSANSSYYRKDLTPSNTVTSTDLTNTVPTSGVKISLYY